MRELIAVLLVDLALAGCVVAAVSLVRPLRFLRIRTRRAALALLGASLALLAVGFLLPARLMQVTAPSSQLDALLPEYQFAEHHEIHVRATPARVMQAVREVTAGEIRFFRALTWLRRFGRPAPENILNPSASRPILQVATSTSFVVLADEPEREVVVGTLIITPHEFRRRLLVRATAVRAAWPKGQPLPRILFASDFADASGPGFAQALMNFRATPDPDGGTRLVTETRVFATDPSSCRRFAWYWRTIYPGSALIRRMWLRAIRDRAEAG